MKTLEEARIRWMRLCGSHPPSEASKHALRSNNAGRRCEEGLRSIFWQIYLLKQPVQDEEAWRRRTMQSRATYASCRNHYMRHIDHPDELSSMSDPLSDDADSPWQTLRKDESLRAEIFQDVERCMQDNYFFREPLTKVRMLDILFVYAKLNPSLGYRQGMHELLATVLWVVEHDAIDQSSLPPAPSSAPQLDEFLMDTLNAQYIEHDSFTLFQAIMDILQQLYAHDEVGGLVDPAYEAPIVKRSRYFLDVLLQKLDPELADYLRTNEILPQIFLTRWTRLLFGREFAFQRCLEMWDAIFAEGLSLELIDSVCVSLLLRIRHQLLTADYSTALSILLRYPSPFPFEPTTFVRDAAQLLKSPTPETAKAIIRKYNQQSKPQHSKMPHGATRARSTPSLRRHAPLPDQMDTTSPALPARLPTLFQDVSSGFQRQTETWGMGVSKAFRGAMAEARKNIEHLQTPASSPPHDHRRRNAEQWNWSHQQSLGVVHEDIKDLQAQVDEQEKRSKTLGKMLGDALEGFRSAQKRGKEGPAADINGQQADQDHDHDDKSIEILLAKIQFVQIYLENPTLPVSEVDDKSRT